MTLRSPSRWFHLLLVLGIGFFALCSGCLAEPVETEAMANRFLEQKLALWQQRLQLQDWTVSLVVSHPKDLRPGTFGNIHWDPDSKTARIRVLSVSDYRGRTYADALKDMEMTVLHELIHLELSALTRNDQSRSAESRTAEEDAVNRIAGTLLELDRGQ